MARPDPARLRRPLFAAFLAGLCLGAAASENAQQGALTSAT